MGAPAPKLLKVDLSQRSWEVEELSQKIMSRWVGGRGLGAYLISRDGRHKLDPFDPAAPLIVTNGPLSGTSAPTSSRTNLTCISPLTKTIFDSNSGGFFGIRLRKAGYVGLLVEGVAETQTILSVDADGVRFLDGSGCWGFGNVATRKYLEETLGRDVATLTIGQAGERTALLSNIAHGDRFFGRGGVGALMGRRNLKAITVHGDRPIEVADPEGFKFMVKECRKWLAAHPVTGKGLPQFGTSVLMNVMNQVQALPVANFAKNHFPEADRIGGETLTEKLLVSNKGCPGCPIGCGRRIELDGEKVEGPEFETLWSFGANLENDDLEAICRINLICNDYGVDTISAGSTMAAARELAGRGLLEWDPMGGGVESLTKTVEELSLAEGNGGALADGSLRLGKAAGDVEVSMTSKGLELPAYDPRGCQGQGLSFATSNRGGCHLRGYMVAPEILASPKLVDRFATSGKAGLAIVSQNLNAAMDSLVLCRFTGFALKDDYYARLLRCAAGVEIDAQSFLTVGERIYNLERLINIARGFTREDDTLPRRLLRESVDEGPSAGVTVDLEPMLDEYYRFRGWDNEGRPTPAKLGSLGLEGFDV